MPDRTHRTDRLNLWLRVCVAALFLLAVAPASAFAWCLGGAPAPNDLDGDDLNDAQESFFGTDPNSVDTDNDGITDDQEDTNQDGIKNIDQLAIFSLERFPDPFSGTGKHDLVIIEGANLFKPNRGISTLFAEIGTPGTQSYARFHARKKDRYAFNVRIARRLQHERTGRVRIRNREGQSNVIEFAPAMDCSAPGPHLMAAAPIVIRTKVNDERITLRYIAFGGCNLLDFNRHSKSTSVLLHLDGGSYLYTAPFGGIANLPTRVMVPENLPGLPRPRFGDLVGVETSEGRSMMVSYDRVVARVFVTRSMLDDDHDRDGLSSRDELLDGTDPLAYDSDGDGANDGVEALFQGGASAPESVQLSAMAPH